MPFFISCNFKSENEKGFSLKNDRSLSQIRPQKPVRIELKRNVKGSYSWDIKGDNVNKIIEVDRKLRKSLKNN